MSDAALRDLAALSGILVDWQDAAGSPRTVTVETLRAVLTALELPCRTDADVVASRKRLMAQRHSVALSIVGEVGRPTKLGGASGTTGQLHLESGETQDIELRDTDGGLEIGSISEPGYHRVVFGRREIAVAIAPKRCFGIADVVPDARLWGVAAQIYSLRQAGDGGIGDFAGVAALARGIAPSGADAVALSPIHALFGARPERFAPYSPSSRLFLNPLHADPVLALGEEYVRRARLRISSNRDSLIDWPARAADKMARFRALFAVLPSAGPMADDLAHFRKEKGDALERHARFEARDQRDGTEFHIFLQWLAEQSLAAAQAAAHDAGMRIGLIADLAVGVDPRGSDAVSHRLAMLAGLSIGAPPDLINPLGQNWGLTALSPHALVTTEFTPFIEVLRANMAHVGGIRIDHAMGLVRLWLIPDGASPNEGAYLTYPLDALLRLIALESVRHQAIVIAEDLGTVPPGFSDRLNRCGILGMRILWFERVGERFVRLGDWRREATAMTSTHDLPPVAGWWAGTDIAARSAAGFYGPDRDGAMARLERRKDRAQFWQALTAAGVARGTQPEPRETGKVVDGALKFVARTPSRLALFPLEDLVGEREQPNLPGTIDQHPNWRRRQRAVTNKLLAAPAVVARLRVLKKERGRP